MKSLAPGLITEVSKGVGSNNWRWWDFPRYGMVFWFSMVLPSGSRVFIQRRVAAVAPSNPPCPFGYNLLASYLDHPPILIEVSYVLLNFRLLQSSTKP
jgi:hypothetical protein